MWWDSNPSWRSRRCSPTCPIANLFSIAFRSTSKDFPKSSWSNPKGKYHKVSQNLFAVNFTIGQMFMISVGHYCLRKLFISLGYYKHRTSAWRGLKSSKSEVIKVTSRSWLVLNEILSAELIMLHSMKHT